MTHEVLVVEQLYFFGELVTRYRPPAGKEPPLHVTRTLARSALTVIVNGPLAARAASGARLITTTPDTTRRAHHFTSLP
jgi:hypothetical protein